MPLERKLIAPFKSGIQTDLKPWLTPEDAVERLQNAYVFRGRIKKKPGFFLSGGTRFKSRLKIKLPQKTTDRGFFTHSLSAHSIKPGQTFQIGSEIFTVPNFESSATGVNLLKTGDSISPVIDLTSKQFTVSSAEINKEVYFFPAQPVMGIEQREFGVASVLETLVFDTNFSYRFDANEGWIQSDTLKFESESTDFFSFADFYGDNVDQTFFYAVNGNPKNQISYLKEKEYTWNRFKPWLKIRDSTDNYLYGGKIIKSFANRLFVFNTFEGIGNPSDPATYVPTNYPYRIRWSPIGARAVIDTTLQPNDPKKNVWPVKGGLGAGWLEIPTRERITAVEVIRENLIVFCERSIWKIVLIASSADEDAKTPFAIKRVNKDFGAESINGVVSIEENIVGLSHLGFFATDGVTVKKIDEKIPDQFLQVDGKKEGFKKVFSIRDVENKLVYWGFPESSATTHDFPNKMFCWNYEYDSWAFFDFSFTAVGFFKKISTFTWAKVSEIFKTWANWNIPWNNWDLKEDETKIIFGNQQGFVFILNKKDTDHSEELIIASMKEQSQKIIIKNHNLKSGDWLHFQLKQNLFPDMGKMHQITVLNKDTISVDNVKFKEGYKGDGFATRLPRISILTKDYMFGVEQGKDFQIPYVDFLLSRTVSGEITIFVYIDSGTRVQIEESVQLGSNVIKMRREDQLKEYTQDLVWKRLFLHTHQNSLQLEITLSDEQMEDLSIATSDMQLHAMLFYVNVEGRLIQ